MGVNDSNCELMREGLLKVMLEGGEAIVPWEETELTFKDHSAVIARRHPENAWSRLGGVALTGHFTSWVLSFFSQFIMRQLSKRNSSEGHSSLHKDGGNWKFQWAGHPCSTTAVHSLFQ